MNPLLFDHLWQSTIVLAAIGLLTLCFRGNGAHVRHGLWTAASLKFLLPFALLNGLGNALSALLAARPVQPPGVQAVYAASQPFSDGPVFAALPAPGTYLLPVTLVWIAGIVAVTAFWLLRWRKLGMALRTARDAGIAAPMPVKFSPTLLEPGLVGIFRPVLLLPEGIAEKLIPAELQAIIAHETCHLRRRDNLTAALHMLVEAIFWFWPPVWWLGTRLIAERERACDEAVLALGNDPQTYAESILKICKHYVSSPLACAAGVSGADLKQRMEEIMKNSVIARLNVPKKALLAVSAVAALALPLAAGVFTAPPVFAQAANRTAANPGTQAAMQRQAETIAKTGQPLTAELTPELANTVRQQQAQTSKAFASVGALKSVTFKGAEGQWDAYGVQFEHGYFIFEIAPLTADGKVSELGFHPATLRTDNSSSPGVEAALRRLLDGRARGQLPYDIIGAGLAAGIRQGRSALAEHEQQNRELGAVKSIAFQKVNTDGFDEYDATYEHGHVTWIVSPLVNGKVDTILWRDAFIDGPAHPGTEAATRRFIAMMESGRPDYSQMTPAMAQVEKEQSANEIQLFKSYGALQSLTFKGGSLTGDMYEAVFEKGKIIVCSTLPLAPDGKMVRVNFNPRQK